MTVSPLSELIGNTLTSSCVHRKLISYSLDGQPVFGTPVTLACRVAPSTQRVVNLDGDIQTDAGYVVIVGGSADVYTGDSLELPDLDLHPIVSRCRYGTDLFGNRTHTEITIL